MRKSNAARLISTMLALILLLTVSACGVKPAATWQEQYDLGVRYLSEGNYKEAILAFTAAIDIDPKQAEAYVKLADVYTAQGDKAKAAEVLTEALSAVGESEAVTSALAALGIVPDDGSSADTPPEAPAGQPGEPLPLGTVVRSERTELGGGRYYIQEFDAEGRVVRYTQYQPNGAATYVAEYFYDAAGNRAAWKVTYPDREDILYEEGRLDLLDRDTETIRYETSGHIHRFTYLYEGTTVTVGAELTAPDGKTAVGTFTHTLLNAEHALQQQGYGWSMDDGKFNYIDLQEYDRDWITVASVTIDTTDRNGGVGQLHCRYEGADVHMTATLTEEGSSSSVSMVYTMSSPDNLIAEGHCSSLHEIYFSEVGTYTGEWTRMVYDVETKTFSKAEY